MAKKRNKIPIEKSETTIPSHKHSWPNLPKQLINSIAKQPNLLHNITSFGCVIKSWRSPSLQCTSGLPLLVEVKNNSIKPQIPHKIDISFHEKHPFPYWSSYRYNYWCPGAYFKGFSHGHVMVLGGDKHSFYLWQPHGLSCLNLPQWDDRIPFKNGAISSFLEYPSRDVKVMVLTGISSPAFAFYCPGERSSDFSWILQDCKTEDPYSPKENMRFTNGIGFDGKFYALSLQGSIVEINHIVDSRFEITRVGLRRAMPAKISRQFREYLMESNGEILLVFLVSRKSIDVVDDVEVFRLVLDKLSWVKVDGIGERTLFLEDDCCMSVDARTIGCNKNCVYYTHGDDQWWIYDMESGDISQACEVREGVLWDEPMEKIKCCCEVDYPRPRLKFGYRRSYF